MSDDRTILDADGILPGTTGAGHPGTDTVTARRYTHPALAEGRVVVRLVPASLGPAEDLAMEFLGFDAEAQTTDVGVGARRALGFPAWALVHDPANGRHALAMVKELERLARLAKSKPGNARDGYEALAARLDGTAPHFLPTFWEQAGRAYIAADNPKNAGACFTRAREADQVHALAIDEDRLGDVYVEFALAGALPVKALQSYARELAQRLPADQAYRQFRTVALQRVAGGLAPHAGMAEDMARLAKAAGQGQVLDVLYELLAMPAIGTATTGFWKSYRNQLKTLVAQQPDTIRRLLAITPKPPGYGDATDDWVAVLRHVGAVAALTGDASPAALPPPDALAWLERMLGNRRWRARRSAALIDLVTAMAAKLARAGRPVDLGDHPDLDVADTLLAAGVPVRRTILLGNGATVDIRLPLDAWLRDEGPGRRDLSALAADKQLSAAWSLAVHEALQGNRYVPRATASLDPAKAARLRAVPAIWRSITDWATRVAQDAAAAPSLAHLHHAQLLLAPLWTEEAATAVAPAARVLAGIDLGAALARTLRTGLPQELCWPGLEGALATFGSTGPAIDLSWPHAVVHDRHRAVIVGPTGAQRGVQLSSLGPNHSPTCLVVDGVLLALWRNQTTWREEGTGWWEGEAEVFAVQSPAVHGIPLNLTGPLMLPLPGGGVTYGAHAWHARDRVAPGRYRTIASDGVSFWRYDSAAGGVGWNEYDPRDGSAGRVSLPRFFEEAADGLVQVQSHLYPLPGGRAAASPLGEVDGLTGLRVRAVDGVTTGERIDGVSCELRLPEGASLRAVVTMPGDGSTRALITPSSAAVFGNELALWDPATGGYATAWGLGDTALPPPYWHFLRTRDEAGSVALRNLGDESAAALLAAARPLFGMNGATAAMTGEVARLVPRIGDATLRTAVALEVLSALGHEAWIRQLPGRAAATAAEPAPAMEPRSDDYVWAMRGVERTVEPWRRHHDEWSQAPAGMVEFARLVSGTATSHRLSWRGMWFDALGAEPALMVRAASPVRPQLHPAMLSLLEALNQVRPVLRPGTLRRLTGVPNDAEYQPGKVMRAGRRVEVVYDPQMLWHINGQSVKGAGVVQYDPDGLLPDIGGLTADTPARGDGYTYPPEAIDEYLAAWRRHGPPPWPSQAVDQLAAATGMPAAEAALILAGLPAIDETGYPDPPVRDPIGVTAKAGREAIDRLRGLDHDQRMRLLAAVVPARPADLWTTGPDVVRVGQVWQKLFPARASMSDELLAEASRLAGDQAGSLVQALTTGTVAPSTLTESDVVSAAALLPWLAYRLPAGHPGRAGLPEGYDRLLTALRYADVRIDLGYTGRELKADAIVSQKVNFGEWYSNELVLSRLTGPDDHALMLIRGLAGPAAIAVPRLYSHDLAALMRAIRDEPAGRTGTLQDPRISVPDLVTQVAARYDLGEDAAAYYLQLLALPDPSDRNVSDWTGRSAADRSRDRKALLGRELVIEAKRERAGRSVFLPGGWLAYRAPRPPIEAWKAPMYGWTAQDLPEQRRYTVAVHVGELFRRAYQRVVDGDVPRLHSLEEQK